MVFDRFWHHAIILALVFHVIGLCLVDCTKAYTLKCRINGGPNNQEGWKNFRNLINGGVKINGGGVGLLETA